MSVLLFNSTAPAADRTLVAEGDYVQQRNQDKPVAHWKLWHLLNGEYEVVESLRGPAHVVQVFHFDVHFLPRLFSLTIDSRPPKVPRNIPFYPTIISCRYNPENLSCAIENNGRKSVASIPAKEPYVLVPGEFYALDYTWFMTGVLQLAKQREAKDDPVNVYVIVDNGIHADRAIKLTYAGEVTARIMGKVQSVTEYEGWRGSELGAWAIPCSSVLRVTTQGLVASVSCGSNPEVGFAIANYKQYQAWPLSR